jgi:hypothetical protein
MTNYTLKSHRHHGVRTIRRSPGHAAQFSQLALPRPVAGASDHALEWRSVPSRDTRKRKGHWPWYSLSVQTLRYLGHDVAEEDRPGDEHEGAENLGYESIAPLTGLWWWRPGFWRARPGKGHVVNGVIWSEVAGVAAGVKVAFTPWEPPQRGGARLKQQAPRCGWRRARRERRRGRSGHVSTLSSKVMG